MDVTGINVFHVKGTEIIFFPDHVRSIHEDIFIRLCYILFYFLLLILADDSGNTLKGVKAVVGLGPFNMMGLFIT